MRPSKRNEIHRFNGELGLTEYTRERQREREREREDTRTMFKKILNLYATLYTYVCSMNTFIQVLEGLTEVPSYFNAL